MEIQHAFSQNDFVNEGFINGIIIKKTIKENYVVFRILTKYDSLNINLSGLLLKENKEISAGLNIGNFVEMKGYITTHISKKTQQPRQSFVITDIKKTNNISSMLFPCISSNSINNGYNNYFHLKGFTKNITVVNNNLAFITLSIYNQTLQALNKAIITVNKQNMKDINKLRKGDIIEVFARLQETPISYKINNKKEYMLEPLILYHINYLEIDTFMK